MRHLKTEIKLKDILCFNFLLCVSTGRCGVPHWPLNLQVSRDTHTTAIWRLLQFITAKSQVSLYFASPPSCTSLSAHLNLNSFYAHTDWNQRPGLFLGKELSPLLSVTLKKRPDLILTQRLSRGWRPLLSRPVSLLSPPSSKTRSSLMDPSDLADETWDGRSRHLYLNFFGPRFLYLHGRGAWPVVRWAHMEG